MQRCDRLHIKLCNSSCWKSLEAWQIAAAHCFFPERRALHQSAFCCLHLWSRCQCWFAPHHLLYSYMLLWMNLKHVVWKCPCASLLYRIFITKWGVTAFSDVCACVRACVRACARTCLFVCHLCVILCKYVAVTILNWTQSFTSHWCSCLTKRKHEWKLQITEWVGTCIYCTHKKVFEFMWSSEIHAQILCKMKWPPKFYILVECSHHPRLLPPPPPPH